jgi:cytoskeletal protein RodZ
MSIEGLGKRLQDARLKRGLTLDEAARMTKIRPSRLAEIEADDFSNFASLAYVKGFLLIYGKFLDVDVSDFMEAFDSPEQVTVDGYSYLQENPAPKPVRPAAVRRSSSGNRTSLMPFFVGVVIIVLGFAFMKFILNILRVSPRTPPPQAQTVQPAPTAAATLAPTATPAPTAVVVSTPRPVPSVESTPARVVAAPTIAPSATVAPATTPVATATPAAVAVATPKPAEKEPEVRRAQPVHAEDLAKAGTTSSSASSPAAKASTASPASSAAATGTQNSVAIKPLRRTYVKVVVDNEARTPAFERWISPNDGTVEFKGQHIDVRILDRDAVQIRKNGKTVADDDTDVTIE